MTRVLWIAGSLCCLTVFAVAVLLIAMFVVAAMAVEEDR